MAARPSGRRRFLGEIGGLLAAAGMPSAHGTQLAASSACVLTPSATEGPFYLDDALVRSDIRDSRPGQPLRLRISVVDVDRGCAPAAGALVSIWHCDATGGYSGEAGSGDRTRFLRGVQPTNADGIAEFLTIYPGWYQPRTVHIHYKVLLGRTDALTSQLYFDDALNREVLGSHPAYRPNGLPRRTNLQDSIAGDRPSLIAVSREPDELEGRFVVGIARNGGSG
jgi:protocatechuate 3,4-dioxygenase beta subunit